eukprot:315126-Prymnesium_polylepis.1
MGAAVIAVLALTRDQAIARADTGGSGGAEGGSGESGSGGDDDDPWGERGWTGQTRMAFVFGVCITLTSIGCNTLLKQVVPRLTEREGRATYSHIHASIFSKLSV